MKTLAVYSMKGGVGKTTTAVTLSHLAASSGCRTLLWDLDPQAASSFAFRVRAHVAGFGRKSFTSGRALRAAVRETDYPNLELLPADFAYRKIERMLDRTSRPEGVFKDLVDAIGQDYDFVVLDCPAGFSLLIESVFGAADVVLVPAIPTVLSLRMVGRVIKWARRTESSIDLVAFLNMVDWRKALHRRVCEWSQHHPDLFPARQVPYASIVEQIPVRRTPLAVFAPRDAATAAFAEIWDAIRPRLRAPGTARLEDRERMLDAIESFIDELESHESVTSRSTADDRHEAPATDLLHSFDTDSRDLARLGQRLELREAADRFVVAGGTAAERGRASESVQVEIDRAWALEILSGVLSPLVALERRLGQPGPHLVQQMRAATGDRPLRRIASTDARDADHVVRFPTTLTRRHA